MIRDEKEMKPKKREWLMWAVVYMNTIQIDCDCNDLPYFYKTKKRALQEHKDFLGGNLKIIKVKVIEI